MTNAACAELTSAECWDVLNAVRVGRVLYTFHALPAVHLVRCAVEQGQIIFSVDPITAARIMRGASTFAAFQADHVATDTSVGRSVTVYGTAGLVNHQYHDSVRTLGLPVYDGDAVYAFIVPLRIHGDLLDLRS